MNKKKSSENQDIFSRFVTDKIFGKIMDYTPIFKYRCVQYVVVNSPNDIRASDYKNNHLIETSSNDFYEHLVNV